MYKALMYKEWLKVRRTYFALAVLSLLTLIYIAVNLAHDIEFNTAKGMWGFIIYQKYPFFEDIKYIILASGIVLAIVQFAPEMSSDRLKLTLHLPVEEKKLLLQLISAGALYLVSLYVLDIAAILIISGAHFSSEFSSSAIMTMLPWLFAGFTSYFAISTVIVEPIWPRRIELLVLFIGYLFFFDIPLDYSSGALILFLIISAFFPLFILISGYHFKRGIKS